METLEKQTEESAKGMGRSSRHGKTGKGYFRVVDKEDLTELLELARDRSSEGRRTLVATIGDLFEGQGEALTERERALMTDILNKLIQEVEGVVRRELSQRLAAREDIPRELVLMLANDEIEVARPILLASEVLKDSDLIEIIRHRSMQHQLSIAMRRKVSESVSDALIEAGHVDVIKALLDNPNSRLSNAAMEYLVEESRRVDTYQEPLVHRSDLPQPLARRICLWVSAALRSHILANHEIDPTELDDLLEAIISDSSNESFAREEMPESAARELARTYREEEELTPEFLVKVLREGEVSLFEALFAEMSGLRMRLIRRIVYEPGGEGLVIVCRALKIEKPVFTSIFLMSRKGRPGDQKVDPNELSRVLVLFDRVKPEAAEAVLKRWRRDPEYLYAVQCVESSRGKSRRGR